MTVKIGALRNPEAGGTVRVVGPATKDASPGDTVTFEVEATPNPGYVFVIWGTESTQATFTNRRASATTVSYEVPRSASVDLSFYVTGYFGPEGGSPTPIPGAWWFTLTTNVNNARWGKAEAVPGPEPVTKYGLSPDMFSHRIVATAFGGYLFSHWELNGTVLDRVRYPADTTFERVFSSVYDHALNFIAVFEPVEIRVTLETSTVAGNGTTTPLSETKVAKFGVPVTFTAKATPNFGWRFVKWAELSSEGVGGSTNAERMFEYTPKGVTDVTIRLGAYFELYPSPGPRPPDYPGPDPDDPEDDGRPAIEISTSVSPDAASQLGATTYPVFQRKTGTAGSSASFTIEAYPQTVGVASATRYKFSHWEDGDGNIVWQDGTYTFTKTFPSSGVDSYGYTAVYVSEEPQRGFRSLYVWAGVREQTQTKPTEGDVMLGYGSYVVAGSGAKVTSDAYGHGQSDYVDVESYVIGSADIDDQKYSIFKDVKFPNVSAVNPTDGHCRFVRWEGREVSGYGPWVVVTTNETVSHEMLKAKFPNNFWGGPYGDESWKWKLWYGTLASSHGQAIELRAVFEIARMVMIGNGTYEPRSEAHCVRIGDVGGTLSSAGFNAKGYVQFPLFPGESVFVPFVKEDDEDSDPPDGYIHTMYDVRISEPHQTSGFSHFFHSTRHYRGISFTAPSDTSDFKTHTGLPGANFNTDRENGWLLMEARLRYHKLTGLPIADYNAFTGEGSGKLLHDAAGQLICDDSACPLESTTT